MDMTKRQIKEVRELRRIIGARVHYLRMQKAVEKQLVVACNFYEQHTEIIRSMAAWEWIVNY